MFFFIEIEIVRGHGPLLWILLQITRYLDDVMQGSE
jgi:hypothetical protein